MGALELTELDESDEADESHQADEELIEDEELDDELELTLCAKAGMAAKPIDPTITDAKIFFIDAKGRK